MPTVAQVRGPYRVVVDRGDSTQPVFSDTNIPTRAKAKTLAKAEALKAGVGARGMVTGGTPQTDLVFYCRVVHDDAGDPSLLTEAVT